MPRMHCQCGYVVEMTDEQREASAGKLVACPECGVTRRVRPLDLPTLELDLPTLEVDHAPPPQRLATPEGKTKQRRQASSSPFVSYRFLSAEDFRFPGERQALFLALTLLLILLAVTTAFTVGVMLAIVAISIAIFKFQESQLLKNCSAVGSHNHDELYDLAQTAASRLATELPNLYIQNDPTLNAFAIGFLGRPSVVLHSAIFKKLTRSELLFIIGHELSHIKCGHTNWLVFTESTSDVLNNPLIRLVSNLFFLSWSRKSEFTCDRGGLLACRNPAAAISALAKVELGEEFATAENARNLLRKFDESGTTTTDISEIFSTHPQTMSRVQAVIEFSRSESFQFLKSQCT